MDRTQLTNSLHKKPARMEELTSYDLQEVY